MGVGGGGSHEAKFSSRVTTVLSLNSETIEIYRPTLRTTPYFVRFQLTEIWSGDYSDVGILAIVAVAAICAVAAVVVGSTSVCLPFQNH